jgi:hypothetical protein
MELSFGPILVDHVAPSMYKSGRNQAQLRQVINRTYASGQVGNNLQDAFVSADQFGFDANQYTENRVCWVDVPADWDVARVEAHLKSMPNARLYKMLSSEPVITSTQEAWMDGVTKEEAQALVQRIADRQLVLDGDGNPVYYKGKPQYRAIFFAATVKEDVDHRSEDLVPRFQVASHKTSEEVNEDIIKTVEAAAPVADVEDEF